MNDYFEPGSTVDVTIRGARVSGRHVQDRSLFLYPADGGRDFHLPLPLDSSIVIRRHTDAPDRSLRAVVAELLVDCAEAIAARSASLSTRPSWTEQVAAEVARAMHTERCMMADCLPYGSDDLRNAEVALVELNRLGLLRTPRPGRFGPVRSTEVANADATSTVGDQNVAVASEATTDRKAPS